MFQILKAGVVGSILLATPVQAVDATIYCAGGPGQPSYAFADLASAKECATRIATGGADCALATRYGACKISGKVPALPAQRVKDVPHCSCIKTVAKNVIGWDFTWQGNPQRLP